MESCIQPTIIAMVMVSVLVTTSGQRCYSDERNPYRYFAAKTRYDDSMKGAEPTSNLQGNQLKRSSRQIKPPLDFRTFVLHQI